MQWFSLLLREETVMFNDDYGVDVNAFVATLDRREAAQAAFEDADTDNNHEDDDE
jgi:orotate phosphoribosyltransferase